MYLKHPTDQNLLAAAEQAYTTRRIDRAAMRVVRKDCRPRAGDLVLARVEKLGHQRKLHRPDTSRRTLFVGDPVIVAYADRYASDQFEAAVPRDLGACELVAGGGVAARVQNSHSRIWRGATRIQPIGLLAYEAEAPPLNVASGALARSGGVAEHSTPVLAVVGSAMNSGKTTSAAWLIHGLRGNGLRVGYAKITGTGAAGDPSLVRDAGASLVLDFTDAGYASTYRVPHAVIESILKDLVGHLLDADVDVCVLEVADGLLQEETARLLESETYRRLVDRTLYACGDSMAAAAGAHWLQSRRLPVAGLTGVLTNSPLQIREAKAATGLSIFGPSELDDSATAMKIVGLEEAVR